MERLFRPSYRLAALATQRYQAAAGFGCITDAQESDLLVGVALVLLSITGVIVCACKRRVRMLAARKAEDSDLSKASRWRLVTAK